MSVKLDPSTKRATVDLGAKMKTIPLTKLNDFAEAYGNLTFEKGTLAITSELAASNGKLTGYIRPLFDDIAIIDLSDTKPFEGCLGNHRRRAVEGLS
jgi:hypothetical protein